MNPRPAILIARTVFPEVVERLLSDKGYACSSAIDMPADTILAGLHQRGLVAFVSGRPLPVVQATTGDDALTPEERAVMEGHVSIGHRILSGIDTPLTLLAREIAQSHHEKWDGSGYPNGLCGFQIPEAARIVAIADVFDALPW